MVMLRGIRSLPDPNDEEQEKKCLSTGKESFKKGDWKAIDERLVNHDQIGSFMWFLTFLCSTLPGALVQFDEYFSAGLKPPFRVIHCGESNGPRNNNRDISQNYQNLTQHTETKFAWGRVVGVSLFSL